MRGIQADRVATIDYILRTPAGQIVDKASEFAYLHGYSTFLVGMESALSGKKVGDEFEEELSPASTFGDKVDTEPMRVHRSDFGPSFQQLQPGIALNAQGRDGAIITYFVVDKVGDYATLSRNHPLAGIPLIFAAKIIDVRDALPEEIESKKAFGRSGENKPSSCGCC